MIRTSTLVFVVLLCACRQDAVAPDAAPSSKAEPTLAFSPADESRGPPSAYPFGPDSYRIGAYTGQGDTEPGLDCSFSTATTRDCRGFLASAVDSTRLDVTLQAPQTAG